MTANELAQFYTGTPCSGASIPPGCGARAHGRAGGSGVWSAARSADSEQVWTCSSAGLASAIGPAGESTTISLLLGAPVLDASLTDTSWVGTGRVWASTRVCSCACWLACSLAFFFFFFLLTPLSPRQRNFSVVTAPVVGGNASSFRSLLVAHRHRLEDHS